MHSFRVLSAEQSRPRLCNLAGTVAQFQGLICRAVTSKAVQSSRNCCTVSGSYLQSSHVQGCAILQELLHSFRVLSAEQSRPRLCNLAGTVAQFHGLICRAVTSKAVQSSRNCCTVSGSYLQSSHVQGCAI